jgi:hypothetical protein
MPAISVLRSTLGLPATSLARRRSAARETVFRKRLPYPVGCAIFLKPASSRFFYACYFSTSKHPWIASHLAGSAAFGCTRNGVSQTFALPCRVRHFPKAYLKQGHSSLSSRFNTLLNCQITVLLAFLRVLRLFTHRLIDQPCLPGPTMLPSI